MGRSTTRIGPILAAACLMAAPASGDAPVTPAPLPRAVVPQVVPNEATPLPTSAVRLTGGPLKRAQDLDADYLLKLEPDRMLAYLRERAGLEPKAKGYGGWDGEGRQLTGHIAGHYLSAVSYMYQATGDDRFKQRADYLVAQLKEIQDKQGDGYIGGLLGNAAPPASRPASRPTTRGAEPKLVDGKVLFQQLAEGQIRSGGFDLNGMWSPWYVQHKLYAGLRDAYRLTGNRAALDVEIKFAEWAQRIVGGLSDEQDQKMLATEFGGMNEVFVDLYADTGDPRWLSLAAKFEDKAIVEPLASGKDILGGKHGNTQVPKLLGTLDRYLYTGDASDGNAARFFWGSVVDHHSFATGGHGYDEYFGPPDKLSGQVDGTGQRSKSLRTAETCNVYNMLKYTRRLFALKPDVRYADFQERALYNHILASIDPDGRTCYMVPVGPGVIHEYQNMFDDFTCCVGTGMESHALHADGLYYEAGDRLWVNVYAPSVLRWAAQSATITQETDFPTGDVVTFKIALTNPKPLTLSFRRPAWAGDGFALAMNGNAIANIGAADSFVDVTRTWTDGDVVTITMPKSLHTEPLPDNPSRVALMWGPLVLAGDFGSQSGDDQAENARQLRTHFPVFPYADQRLTDWLQPFEGKPGLFRAKTTDGTDVTLSPFYTLHHRRYSLYWDLFTPTQWAERKAAYSAQQAKQHALETATVTYFQPGEMQAERDVNFQAEGSRPIRDDGQPGRVGGEWMSMEIAVDPVEPVAVIITARVKADAKPAFDLLVGDTVIAEPTVQDDETSGFVNLMFRVPPSLTSERKRATLRLQAHPGGQLPPVFGVRVVREKEAAIGDR